jgi:hypothetical protein
MRPAQPKRTARRAPVAEKKVSTSTTSDAENASTGGTTKAAGKKQRRQEKFKIEAIWGKDLIEGLGFTAIPSILLERQADLGLDPVDVTILLHLASFWRDRNNPPWPSKKTLAIRMGTTPRTVQRHTARLEEKGFISRVARKKSHGGTQSNTYYLDGLIEAARPLAEATRQLRIKHKREAASRVSFTSRSSAEEGDE